MPINNMFTLLFIAVLFLVAAEVYKIIIDKAKKEVDKIDNIKVKQALNKLLDIIQKCVSATNQTIVKDLKESGKFDKKGMRDAFNRTKGHVNQILDEESKKILSETYSDLDAYINNAIETEVNKQKSN